MISALNGLPEGVIGFEASGKIAAEDYRDVVVPALEQAAKAGDVRFIVGTDSGDSLVLADEHPLLPDR
jgi:hypothetical protein